MMYGWDMGIGGWIFMALFWIVIIGLVIWAVTALLPGTRAGEQGRKETPEEILSRRFASGEIDAEQYQQAREELAATRSVRRWGR